MCPMQKKISLQQLKQFEDLGLFLYFVCSNSPIKTYLPIINKNPGICPKLPHT